MKWEKQKIKWACRLMFEARSVSPLFVVIPALSSLLFVCLVHCLLSWCSLGLVLVFTGIGVPWCWVGVCWWHSLVLVLVFTSVGVGVCWYWCLLALVLALALFVILASIIVSTTISLYEQWLAGRVVVLCDMASTLLSRTELIATLWADAHNGGMRHREAFL